MRGQQGLPSKPAGQVRLCSMTGQGCWLGLPACRRKLAVLGQQVLRARLEAAQGRGLGSLAHGARSYALQFGRGCQLASLPQLGSGMSFTAAQGLRLGLLVRQGWRLCLGALPLGQSAGCGPKLGRTSTNLSGQTGHRLGSADGQSCWLRSKIRHHCQQKFVCRDLHARFCEAALLHLQLFPQLFPRGDT